jgi:hypothetical protein
VQVFSYFVQATAHLLIKSERETAGYDSFLTSDGPFTVQTT